MKSQKPTWRRPSAAAVGSALGLHPDIDPPTVVRVTLAGVLRVRVPSVLDLLHGPRQHPSGDVGIPDGRTLPECDLVVAELAEEDAAGHIVEHPRPELFLLD